MTIISPKKIKHFSRYFGIIGFLCLVGYAYTSFSHLFLILVAPVFFITYWFRVYTGFLSSLIPNAPFFNNLLLLFWTEIYFGLVGFQLKNILNERGKIRFLVLVAFVGFLIYIHYAAFQELNLYWTEKEPSAHLGTAPDVPLGNNESQEGIPGGGEKHPL